MPNPISLSVKDHSLTTTQQYPTTEGKAWHVPFSAAIGGASGSAICYPGESLKKMIQSGQQVLFHPRNIYRGVSSFSASVTLATMTSMTFHHLLQQTSFYDPKSTTHQTVAAIGSGIIGATVASTPVENIILRLQLEKIGPIPAIRSLLKQGITRPWVGLKPLWAREGIFVGIMLSGGKLVNNKVYQKTKNQLLANSAELALSVGGAFASHPWDCIATRMQQSDGALKMVPAIKQLYKESGISGFFRGANQRALLFVGCATLIPRIEKQVHQWLTRHA